MTDQPLRMQREVHGQGQEYGIVSAFAKLLVTVNREQQNDLAGADDICKGSSKAIRPGLSRDNWNEHYLEIIFPAYTIPLICSNDPLFLSVLRAI